MMTMCEKWLHAVGFMTVVFIVVGIGQACAPSDRPPDQSISPAAVARLAFDLDGVVCYVYRSYAISCVKVR